MFPCRGWVAPCQRAPGSIKGLPRRCQSRRSGEAWLEARQPSGLASALDGGRTWWAHFEFTRINIGPTILRKKIDESPTFLTLRDFLGVVDRSASPSSVQPSPDVAQTLRNSAVSPGGGRFIVIGILWGERPRACRLPQACMASQAVPAASQVRSHRTRRICR